jgi:hypothetical protein
MRAFLAVLALSCLGGTAVAEEDVIVGDPASCHIRVEYAAKEQMLHLRPKVLTGSDCKITPLMMQVGLYQALDRYRDKNLKLIFLGRLESYPWLSDELFQRARFGSTGPGFWDETTGHPADVTSDNEYVAAVLYGQVASICPSEICARPMLADVAAVLAEQGYRLTGVSAEKVLVREAPPTGGVEWLPGGKFPVDALIHLDIAKKD